ncbi:MAG: hypothetical protein ACKO46_03190, partial [Alphaproteobacteria bacterium]
MLSSDPKIIKAHELYNDGSAPSIQSSDSIIFVLNGEDSTPKKFLDLFKNYYQKQYDGKKLVFLHSNGGHWTTYECDYKYDENSIPNITKHEIRGDGRCGLHAVAKALAIVSGNQGLVEERELHNNKYYQVPDNFGAAGDQIFAHLGLNKSDLQNVWIGRVVKKNPNNPSQPEVVKTGTMLSNRILQLQAKSVHEHWLSSEDIDNILIHTNIRASGNKGIFLASMDEQFKMIVQTGGQELQNEVFRAILDDKNWKLEPVSANKMDKQKYINAQSHDKFPEKMKEHFNKVLTDNTTRSDALKLRLREYQDFDYNKTDGGKIRVTDVDKFDHIPDFPEKEKFLGFVVDNHGLFNGELKALIAKTLMLLKIKNMVQGSNQSNKNEYNLNFPKDDALARHKKNDLIDNLLEVYPENSEGKAIDEDKKKELKKSIHEVYSDAPAPIPEKVITVEKGNVKTIETKKGGTASKADIKKLNSIDYKDFDEDKLKKLKYLKITSDNDKVEVKKVVADPKDETKTTLVDFVDDKKYQEVACYSEYVKYAESKVGDKKDAMDFFALQPKKYHGYGLKIRLEAEGDLFFDGCFN